MLRSISVGARPELVGPCGVTVTRMGRLSATRGPKDPWLIDGDDFNDPLIGDEAEVPYTVTVAGDGFVDKVE